MSPLETTIYLDNSLPDKKKNCTIFKSGSPLQANWGAIMIIYVNRILNLSVSILMISFFFLWLIDWHFSKTKISWCSDCEVCGFIKSGSEFRKYSSCFSGLSPLTRKINRNQRTLQEIYYKGKLNLFYKYMICKTIKYII